MEVLRFAERHALGNLERTLSLVGLDYLMWADESAAIGWVGIDFFYDTHCSLPAITKFTIVVPLIFVWKSSTQ